MLEVFVCNVGDGDAILLTERREGAPDYTVLVDAGRPYVEPGEGSLRKEALYFLKARGVRSLDRMILSHPHIDHVGGAERILRAIPTKRLTMLTLPPEHPVWISPSFTSGDKTQNGLRHMLNLLDSIASAARETGCALEQAAAGTERLTDRLSMTTILPKIGFVRRQADLFKKLYAGEPVNDEDSFRVSKERNQCSLMHRFSYAGRSVLLTGDRYASEWEDEAIPPCDVFKLPHHGDGKSVTKKALKRIAPMIAIVSCQSDPRAGKDRPNAEALALTQAAAATVLCTENREMPTLPAASYNGVCVTITEDGTIGCRTE
ncbi:MAG: MBL fold metallo-hydrolase [Clostridia bacterium]|nr:MBL fold metallo-hydrolase [Clostridia bacterium]